MKPCIRTINYLLFIFFINWYINYFFNQQNLPLPQQYATQWVLQYQLRMLTDLLLLLLLGKTVLRDVYKTMISYVTALTSVQIKQHQCVTSIKTEEQTSKFLYKIMHLHVWLILYTNVSTILFQYIFYKISNTVKPVHAVTSIKQSPALKGHIFLVLS
jgi:hypothetical protein